MILLSQMSMQQFKTRIMNDVKDKLYKTSINQFCRHHTMLPQGAPVSVQYSQDWGELITNDNGASLATFK